mmetsp:Transcript_9808/g.18940  ORF Transcript_9808/g.18940 Transcript_9808/m.18940 type:complete len:262 (+) Transcript_9808:643-1428(+)
MGLEEETGACSPFPPESVKLDTEVAHVTHKSTHSRLRVVSVVHDTNQLRCEILLRMLSLRISDLVVTFRPLPSIGLLTTRVMAFSSSGPESAVAGLFSSGLRLVVRVERHISMMKHRRKSRPESETPISAATRGEVASCSGVKFPHIPRTSNGTPALSVFSQRLGGSSPIERQSSSSNRAISSMVQFVMHMALSPLLRRNDSIWHRSKFRIGHFALEFNASKRIKLSLSCSGRVPTAASNAATLMSIVATPRNKGGVLDRS